MVKHVGLTQRELDIMWMEMELEFEDIENEFNEEFLADRQQTGVDINATEEPENISPRTGRRGTANVSGDAYRAESRRTD